MPDITREDAQEFSEALDSIGSGWYRQAVLAHKLGIPQALGLSWGAWADRYMPRIKMAIKEREAVVSELAKEGLSNRKIAGVLGVDEGTVRLSCGTKKQGGADKSAPDAPKANNEAISGELAADKSAPAPLDLTARAARLERDNAAEQKRNAREEREDAIGEVPAPDIRTGALSVALADVRGVDLVFTDPPYPQEFLPVWSELAEWAAQALKPGALLLAYSGQYHLRKVMARLDAHLSYQWLGWVATPGPAVSVHQRPISSQGKPLLIYSNGPIQAPYSSRRFLDVAQSAGRTRELHEWEQHEAPAAYWIDALTERGELVADPFLGSGTFAVVAQRLGRSFVGCDLNPDAIETTRKRLSER